MEPFGSLPMLQIRASSNLANVELSSFSSSSNAEGPVVVVSNEQRLDAGPAICRFGTAAVQLCSLPASQCGRAGQPSSVLRRARVNAAVAAVGRGQDIYPSRDPLKQSQIDAWLDMARGLERPLNVWLHPQTAPDAHLLNKADAKKEVVRALAAIEQHLRSHTFLVGDSLTLADSNMALTLLEAFRSLIGQQEQRQLRSVTRWLATCMEHPALAGAAGELKLCSKAVGWTIQGATQKPAVPHQNGLQHQNAGAGSDDEDTGSPTATENGPAVQPVSHQAVSEAMQKAGSTPTDGAAPAGGASAAMRAARDGTGAGAGGAGEEAEDPLKKAKKDAKAAEKAAKKAKAAAKKKALEAKEAEATRGAAGTRKAKAKAEADVKKAEDAAQQQKLIEAAQTTPRGQRKDVSGEMAKGYMPLAVEAAWYDWWEQCGFFKPEEDSDKPPFVIVIPPPNVTGSLHLGHALTNAIQDTVVRWRRMKGYNCLWLPGTDHAGIATQTVVEKQLAREKGLTRHDLGRDKFLQEVFAWVDNYRGKIRTQLCRIGSSVDWSRLRFTMDDDLCAAVREAFVRLHGDGLIYRDNRLVNWCCTLHTAVSDIEVDYHEVKGRDLIKVPGCNEPVEVGVLTSFAYPLEGGEGEIVVATTRPETMLGDTAVAVHPEDPRYKHLHGKFVVHPLDGRKIPIVLDAELVDMGFGTGAVKITPAHDPNDFATGKRHKLEFINILNDDGSINRHGGRFQGQKRFDVRRTLVEWLKEEGLFRGTADNAMSIPLCSRSKDIIEPVLKPQWWVSCAGMAQMGVQAVKEGQLEIVPREFEATWYRWLENIRDWCISRQLWWGHRIPAYYISLEGDPEAGKPGTNSERTDRWVVGATQEAAEQQAEKRFPSKRFTLIQDDDVLDTWFSSGLWPFSTMGWPQQTPDLENFYPGALLETGHDILFFWVARMVMLGMKLTGTVPFKQVYLHSMVRDAHGRKMSKSLGNVIDPVHVIEGITLQGLHDTLKDGNLPESEVKRAMEGQKADFPAGIEECGTDALRFALAAYTSQGRDINLDINRVVAYRHWCNKLWNAIRFAVLNLGPEFVPTGRLESPTFGCQWILSCLTGAVQATDAALEAYEFSAATTAVYDFWQYKLCDVFIELMKPVMRSGDAHAQQVTRETLYICLEVGLRLLHPFMPFVTEELWQRLPQQQSADQRWADQHRSIMTQAYPRPNKAWANPDVEQQMALAQSVVGAARKLRSDYALQREKPRMFIAPVASPAGSTADQQQAAASGGPAADTQPVKTKAVPPYACKDRQQTGNLCKDQQRSDALASITSEIAALSFSSEVELLGPGQSVPSGCAPNVVDDATIVYLLLTGILDPQKELDKLAKDQTRVEERGEVIKKKMATPDYAGKTPVRIKEQDMEALGKAQKELRAVQQQITDMQRLLRS